MAAFATAAAAAAAAGPFRVRVGGGWWTRVETKPAQIETVNHALPPKTDD